ncbi:MAG: hypothetical protein Q7K25_07585 [Actinomycetota bacterium]|nr:hypothetical protein [Actinomycetota bacterium]
MIAPSGAQAADAQGCSGNAASFTAAGEALDLAYAPGIGGTEDHPFVIDMEGKVQWEGSTKAVLRSGNYSVTVSGIPVKSDSFTNKDKLKRSSGEYNLSELPSEVSFLLSALGEAKIPVEVEVTSPNGTCTASGWITGHGSPFASPLFYSGLLLILLFLLMLFGIIWL